MRAVALAIVVAACRQPPAPTTTTVVSHSTAPAPDAAPPPDAPSDETYVLLPGCSEREREAREAEIEAIHGKLYGGATDPETIVDEIRTLLDRPCMRHIKPAFRLPAEPTIATLRAAFEEGFDYQLKQAASGLVARRGKMFQVIPPGLFPDLSAKQKKTVTNMACRATDGSCAPAAAYILRAEAAFDARLEQRTNADFPHIENSTNYPELRAQLCDNETWKVRDEEDPRPSTFEAWVSCVANRVPTTLRFHERNLQPPASGWLVLWGDRGHYQVASEIRAYDLTTGAAYVASNSNNFSPAPGVTPGMTAYTGRIDPGHARELAFMLLAQDAIVPVRTWRYFAEVPAKLPRELTKPTKYPAMNEWSRIVISSSSETTIYYALIDGNTRTEGSFTWDADFDWIDGYLDHLTEVMEAGLIKACAPAKLPAAKQLAIPADRDKDLVKAFDDLRTSVCKGVR